MTTVTHAEMLRTCTKCGVRKPVEDYWKSRIDKNGTVHYKGKCIACSSKPKKVVAKSKSNVNLNMLAHAIVTRQKFVEDA